MSREAPVSWPLVANTARTYWRRRRYLAGLRALFLTIVLRHGSELCMDCGGRYGAFIWHAPDPLWREVVGRPGGLLCPRCFERRCTARGIWTRWVPTVTGRSNDVGELVPTTNWWHDAGHDYAAMGIADPLAFERRRSETETT